MLYQAHLPPVAFGDRTNRLANTGTTKQNSLPTSASPKWRGTWRTASSPPPTSLACASAHPLSLSSASCYPQVHPGGPVLASLLPLPDSWLRPVHFKASALHGSPGLRTLSSWPHELPRAEYPAMWTAHFPPTYASPHPNCHEPSPPWGRELGRGRWWGCDLCWCLALWCGLWCGLWCRFLLDSGLPLGGTLRLHNRSIISLIIDNHGVSLVPPPCQRFSHPLSHPITDTSLDFGWNPCTTDTATPLQRVPNLPLTRLSIPQLIGV